MRDYELTYIVHPEVDQEGAKAVTEEVKTLIESTGGVVHEVKPWGLRRLAYPIRNVREGQYVFMRIGLEATAVAELERGLQLKEPVIRHLVVRVDKD
jgi:small subunit ribosomal protein S6